MIYSLCFWGYFEEIGSLFMKHFKVAFIFGAPYILFNENGEFCKILYFKYCQANPNKWFIMTASVYNKIISKRII